MTVHNLARTSFDKLMDCFFQAFEDYTIKMPTDKQYYWERWKAAKVDFTYSYGMTEKGRLVGFIINAVDKRGGILTAFNTGTGVIPEYRGRRIVKAIYDYALKDLGENGIGKCTLEVITDNEIAIRSYESIGFKIIKTYKCFSGSIAMDYNDLIEVEEVPIHTVTWENLPGQVSYSWDFQKETLLGGKYRFYRVLSDKEPESFFIINPNNQYLAQFDILNANHESWQRLFSAINQVSSSIKVNNVDDRLKDKLYYLNLFGLQNTIDQYEMELKIENGIPNDQSQLY